MIGAHNQPEKGRIVTDERSQPTSVFAVDVSQRLERAQAQRLTAVPALFRDKVLDDGRRIHSGVSKEQVDAIAQAYKNAQRTFIDARYKLLCRQKSKHGKSSFSGRWYHQLPEKLTTGANDE